MQGPAIDTHAHVFRQGLALADTRRHTPDYDADAIPGLAGRARRGARRAGAASFLGTDNSHLVAALRAPPPPAARGRRGVARHRGGGSAGAGRGRRGRHPAQPDRPAPARAGPARLAGIAGARQHAGLACGSASAGEPPARYHAGPAGRRLPRGHRPLGRRTRPWASPTPLICCARPTAARSGSSWRRPIATGRRRTVRRPAVKPPGCCWTPTRPTDSCGQRLAPYRASPPGVLHRGDAVAGRLDRLMPRRGKQCLPIPAAVVSIHWRSTMTLCSNASPAAALLLAAGLLAGGAARPRPPTPSARSRWWSPIRPAARSTSLPA